MVELRGSTEIPAARDAVYAALQDPGVLRRCIEGCDQLTETEPGVYDAQLRLGLGAIRGRYTGRARVRDPHPPESFTLSVEGKGPGGRVPGDAPLVLAADVDRLRRFHAEARAASSLNHPNILVIHDFGEIDGRPFMVSELVEGQTLRQRLEQGPLPVREAVDLATQVASALAAAHARG